MRLLLPIALTVSSSLALAQVPCFDQNFGTPQGLGDDAFSAPQPLGFTFHYGGVAYTDIQICSNGYIVFGVGSPGAADFSPTVAELLGNAEPRLCPLWSDLDPTAGGEIYFNAVPATTTTPAHAIITYDSVPFWGTSNPATYQAILFDGDGIQIHYDANVQNGTGPWVAGASPGNGATANPVDFAVLPIITSGNATLHQDGPNGFSRGESTLTWTADGAGGYIITEITGCASSSSIGSGCYDKPRMVFEDFPAATLAADLAGTSWQMIFTPTPSGGAYLITPGGPAFDGATPTTSPNSTDILLGNYSSSSSGSWDDASLLYPLPAAFANGIDYPGGNTTDIIINSNAKIYFGNTTSPSFSFNGAPHGGLGGFSNELPCIAPFLNDLDPTTGGSIFVEDPSPSGGIRITWLGISNWQSATAGSPTAVPNDIQVEILPNSMITMAFGPNLGCSGSATNNGITGFSAGNSEPESVPIDWSAITGLTTGDGSFSPVLSLDAPPVYGSSFDVVIGNLSPGTAVPIGGLISIGFGAAPPGGIPLPNIGVPMPGCNLYLDPNAIVTNILLGNTGTGDMRWTWNLPPTGSNFPVYLQGATFTPTPYNTVGILATNGVEAVLGL